MTQKYKFQTGKFLIIYFIKRMVDLMINNTWNKTNKKRIEGRGIFSNKRISKIERIKYNEEIRRMKKESKIMKYEEEIKIKNQKINEIRNL